MSPITTYAMMQESILENVIQRYMSQADRNLKRGLRNLVALGQETAQGTLSRRFLQSVQRTLERENSPYYAMVRKLLRSVDHERILRYGVNLGWHGLVQGTKRIRELETRQGYHVPWSLTLQIGSGKDVLNSAAYIRLVEEGKALGIATYFLSLEDSGALSTALDLADAHRDCAFTLLLPGGSWSSAALDRCRPCQNVMIGLDGGSPDLAQAAARAQERRLLYLIYRRYSTDQEAREIVSGAWARQIMPYASVAAAVVPTGSDLPPEDKASVYRYIVDARKGQRYPALLFDGCSDILYVDGCISGAPGLVSVASNGAVSAYWDGRKMETGLSIPQVSLTQVLRRFPHRRDPAGRGSHGA